MRGVLSSTMTCPSEMTFLLLSSQVDTRRKFGDTTHTTVQIRLRRILWRRNKAIIWRWFTRNHRQSVRFGGNAGAPRSNVAPRRPDQTSEEVYRFIFAEIALWYLAYIQGIGDRRFRDVAFSFGDCKHQPYPV